eukprot:6435326-Amphidinium_carterae.3
MHGAATNGWSKYASVVRQRLRTKCKRKTTSSFRIPLRNFDASVERPTVQEVLPAAGRKERRNSIYVGRAYGVVRDFHDEGNGPNMNTAMMKHFPLLSLKPFIPHTQNTAWVEQVRTMDIISACDMRRARGRIAQHPTQADP